VYYYLARNLDLRLEGIAHEASLATLEPRTAA